MTLDWPPGWPRTPTHQRKRGTFSQRGAANQYGYSSRQSLTITTATRRVQEEVTRMRGTDLRIDTAHRDEDYRLDGFLRSTARVPDDPGVVVRFRVKAHPIEFACDAYTRIQDNLAAVAATIEAKRTVLRHGCATADREFQGYYALPPGDVVVEPPPHVVLGVAPDATQDEIRKAFRALALETHPDRGGDRDAWHQLKAAYAKLTEATP